MRRSRLLYILSVIGGLFILGAVGRALYFDQFRGLPQLNSLGVKELEQYEREFGADLYRGVENTTDRRYIHHTKRGATAPLDSPDGGYTARMEGLLTFGSTDLLLARSSWHRIIVTMNRGERSNHPVIAIQESDPGSGLSFGYRWSSNSKALFIFGDGRPYGQDRPGEFSFIYLVPDGKLYVVDVKEWFLKD